MARQRKPKRAVLVLEIDKYALDEEWLDQPHRLHEAGKRAALAKKELDEAEDLLSRTKAHLSLRIRQAPGKFKLKNPREDAIASTILMQPEYEDAVADVRAKRLALDVARSLALAFEHRRSSLKYAVELWKGGYGGGDVPKAQARSKVGRRLDFDDDDEF